MSIAGQCTTYDELYDQLNIDTLNDELDAIDAEGDLYEDGV